MSDEKDFPHPVVSYSERDQLARNYAEARELVAGAEGLALEELVSGKLDPSLNLPEKLTQAFELYGETAGFLDSVSIEGRVDVNRLKEEAEKLEDADFKEIVLQSGGYLIRVQKATDIPIAFNGTSNLLPFFSKPASEKI